MGYLTRKCPAWISSAKSQRPTGIMAEEAPDRASPSMSNRWLKYWTLSLATVGLRLVSEFGSEIGEVESEVVLQINQAEYSSTHFR